MPVLREVCGETCFARAAIRNACMTCGRSELMNYRILLCLTLPLALSYSQGAAAEGAAAKKNATPPAPPMPGIRSLKFEPASLTLHDGRDEQRVLIFGETASGQRFDVTDNAVLTTESSNVEIDKSGYV